MSHDIIARRCRKLLLTAVLLSTAAERSFAACGTSASALAGTTSIQSAVNAAPATLTLGDHCVSVGAGTYSEQVTIANINPNNFRIVISSAPGATVTVTPPAGSTAAFLLANASVTLQGITIAPTASTSYGVLASSPSIKITSVNVTGANITFAGVSITSQSVLSYSNITGPTTNFIPSYGVLVYGSLSTIVFSTITANNQSIALGLLGASSSTITSNYIYNGFGRGIVLAYGASYNTIAKSTVTGVGGDFNSAIEIIGITSTAAYNTVAQSYLSGLSGAIGLQCWWGSTNLTIVQSTITSSQLAFLASLSISNDCSSTTITQSYISYTGGQNGTAVAIGATANTTISLSTITSNGLQALFVTASSSTIDRSYIVNTAGYAVMLGTGANSTTITQSTITSSASGYAAVFLNAASSNTIIQSYVTNLAGFGVYIDTNSNGNVVSQSVLTSSAAGGGAIFIFGSSNSIVRSSLSNPAGNAVGLVSNASYNSITFSTVSSNNPDGWSSLRIEGASYNTIANSLVSNPGGLVTNMFANAHHNTITQSTITSGPYMGATRSCCILRMANASSNTVTQSYLFSPWSENVGFWGSYNIISQSRIENVATVSGFAVTFGSGALYNTLTQTTISNSGLAGILLANGAAFNVISKSTITTNSSGSRGYGGSAVGFSGNASGNTITQSYLSNPSGFGVFASTQNVDTDANINIGNIFSQNTIISTSSYPTVYLAWSSSTLVSNCTIQGSTPIRVLNSTNTVLNSNVLIATNTFGNGLWLSGGNAGLSASGNSITGGAQAAGILLDAGNQDAIILSTNVIATGPRYGIFVATQSPGTQVWITSNTIAPTVTSANNTYGIYLNGLYSGATIQNNGIYYRSPGSMGGFVSYGLYAQSALGLNIDHNRFNQPAMISGGSYSAAYFNGTQQVAFKFNDINVVGAGLANGHLLQLALSTVTVKGNIFFSSMSVTGSSATVMADAQSGIFSDYNDFFSSNSFNTLTWGAGSYQFPWSSTTGQDSNSIAVNPFWANSAAGIEDFHPAAQRGRCSVPLPYNTGTSPPSCNAYATDAVTSFTIDAGDPLETYGLEPTPSGSRVNQGSYANTAEASKSAPPPTNPIVAAVFTSSVTLSYGTVASDGYTAEASLAANFASVVSSGTTNPMTTQLSPSGLSSNTTYFLRVGALYGGSTNYRTTTPPATVTLTAPLSAASLSNVFYTSATAQWTALPAAPPSATAEGYRLEASSTNFGAGTVYSSATTAVALNTLTVSGLSLNTTYYFRAASLNWAGAPNYTTLGSTVTLAAPPSALAVGAVSSTSVSLSWSAGGNPVWTPYEVSLSTDDFLTSFSTPVAFAANLTAAATTLSLAGGTTYYFRVRAQNAAAVETAFSAAASTVTVPGLLTSISTSAPSTTAASWSWTNTAGPAVQSYSVYTASNAVLLATTGALSFARTGLSTNTAYGVLIGAVDATGPGPLSPPVTAYTLAAAPSASAFTAVHLSSLTLSWSANGNPGGTLYEVYRSTDNIAFVLLSTQTAATLSDTQIGNATFYYKVRAKNGDGLATAFDVTLSTFLAGQTPAAPSGLTASNPEGGLVTLAWTPSVGPDVLQYDVYWDSGTGAVDYNVTYTTVAASETSVTLGPLPAATYYFALRAKNTIFLEEKNVNVRASVTLPVSAPFSNWTQAQIHTPRAGRKVWGNRVTVLASVIRGSPALAQASFQYRSAASTTAPWTPIPAVAADNPRAGPLFLIHWDVTVLAPGDYELRSVASNAAGQADPAAPTRLLTVDSVDPDIEELLLGGSLQHREKVENTASNTIVLGSLSGDRYHQVVLPAGALGATPSTVLKVLNPPASVPAVPPELSAVGVFYDITLENGQTALSAAAWLTSFYRDDDGDGIVDGTPARADRLKFMAYNPASGKWIAENPTTLDFGGKTAAAPTGHFSLFGLFAPSAVDLDRVRVYPNPFVPNDGSDDNGKAFNSSDPFSGVIFDNITQAARIQVFTVSGQLVWETTVSNTSGKIQWDGRNSNGREVASGGYIAVIGDTATGRKAVRKIAIIR